MSEAKRMAVKAFGKIGCLDDIAGENATTGGLLPGEQLVMDDLVSAWNKFIKLEKQHPCDINEFGDAVHRLQGILALRPLRRQYPDYWKSYKE